MILLFKQYRFGFLLSCCIVVALAARPAYGDGHIYSIHIHTVNSATQAGKQVDTLNRQGYDAFYRHMPSFEEGLQYRIFVGKYASKKEAVTAINKLWNSNLSDHYAIAVLKNRTASPSRKTQHQVKETDDHEAAAAEHPKVPAQPPLHAKPPAEAISEKPEKETPAKLLGDALVAYHAGQYEKSLALLNDLSESIENKDILFWTAICKTKLDQNRDAAEKMSLFLAGAPNSPQGMLELAAILFQQGNKREARELLERAEAFQPPSGMIKHVEQMRRALKENPEEGFWSNFDFLIKDKKRMPDTEQAEPKIRNSKPPGKFYQIGSESEALLRKAQQIKPDNTAVAYYLGFLDIRKNRLDDAIRQWETYLSTAAENPRTAHLRKQMMVLCFRHAAIASLRALQSNREIIPSRTDNSIVVTDFRNRCFSSLPGMEQGMAAMLADDLHKVDAVHVTNRILTQSMFRSMRADLAPALDAYRAGMLGRKLASRFVVWGEFTDISENAFQFTVTVTDARNFTNVGMAEIKGTRDEFYLLEKRLVYWILESIGIHRKDLLPETIFAMEQPYTRRFDAFLPYARGMAYLSTQQFQKAAKAFQQAVQRDSSFALARKALQSTPDDIYYCPFFEQSEILSATIPEESSS